MFQIPGYKNCRLLTERAPVRVFEGFREDDDLPVVLQEFEIALDNEDRARLQHELSLFESTYIPGAVFPIATVQVDRGVVVVSPRLEGTSLDRLTDDGETIAIESFIHIALEVTGILGKMHQAGILHRNLRPTNILVPIAEKVGGLRIVDPGLSVLFHNAMRSLWSPHVIQRVLPYVAPEQTGRLGRDVDHRSDLYSLGVICYELLCGKRPFQERDPLALIHSHIALEAEPLTSARPDISKSISGIVMKLLEKDPEQRYQSASGLIADLERCRDELASHGVICAFRPGQNDVVEILQVSSRLYGRESEKEILEEALEQACSGRPNLLLLSGPPGIGKSALAGWVARSAHLRNCHFLTGKCQQYNRDRPYLPFSQAFAALTEQLLLESDESLESWKLDFGRSIGALGQIIVDLCPEMSRIVGPQLELPALPPQESQTRANLAIKRFISMLAATEHPLVLFFDDLQWADRASLDFLEELFSGMWERCLLVVGTYRDTEIHETHPVTMVVEGIRRQGVPIRTGALPSLKAHHIRELLVDSLLCTAADAETPAQLIHSKTLGNPFFVLTFIRSLHASGFVQRFPDRGWVWDLEAIRNRHVTDNVVDLVCDRLAHMPEPTRKILNYAAIAGSQVDLEMLALLSGQDLAGILRTLEPAFRAELIRETDGRIDFVHDRVQEAACTLIGEKELPSWHLNVGRMLLAHFDEKQRDERLFEIVEHFNAAIEEIPEDEKARAADLNVLALEKAKRSAAFVTALDFAEHAIRLLGFDAWKQKYDLSFRLQQERVELKFLTGDFTGAEEGAKQLLSVAAGPVDQAKAGSLLLQQYNMQARYSEAIDVAREALALVSVDLPVENVAIRFEEELVRSKLLLEKRPLSSLLDAPLMADSGKSIALEILALVAPAIFVSRPELFKISSILMTNISLEYGHTTFSCYAYAVYGFILAMDRGEYRLAYDFGEIGMRLADQFGDPIQQCRTTHMAGFIQHYVAHIRETNHLFKKGFNAGVECGEIEWSCIHAHFRAARLAIEGTPLIETQSELDRLRDYTDRAGNLHAVHLIDAVRFPIAYLSEPSDRTDIPCGTLSETEQLDLWEKKESFFAIFIYRVLKSYVRYIFGHYEGALTEAQRSLELSVYAPNHIYVEIAHFLKGMSLLGVSHSTDDENKAVHITQAREELDRMKILAEGCPDNYLDKRLLLEAELARANGDDGSAWRLYDDAYRQAQETGFVQQGALACELAMRFWIEKGKDDFAAPYFECAIEGYRRWGAAKKIVTLKAELEKEIETGSMTRESLLGEIDFHSLFKATQAISREIELPRLIERLMKVILENAGAQRGALLLYRSGSEDELCLVSSVDAEADTVEVFEWQPLTDSQKLCLDVVRYVTRTGEPLVVTDAAADQRFRNVPYVVSNRSRSLLCMPVQHGDKKKGLLYLENNLSSDVFTSERLVSLEVLVTQAAISLENAELFTKSRETEQILRESEERLQTLFEGIDDTIFLHDEEGRIIDCNDAACRQLGYTREELLGMRMRNLESPEFAASHERRLARQLRKKHFTCEGVHISRDGLRIPVHIHTSVIEYFGERAVLAVIRDFTERINAEEERQKLEDQLRQAQKMEAIGQLAGGVAHDFNNLLQAIIGYQNLAMHRLEPGHVIHEDLEQATRAADKAAELTRQLLAFSRRQMLQPEDLNLNELVDRSLKMIRRVIGEHIAFDFTPGVDLSFVRADPGQMEQILMNLCINARDAMPDGGKLTIETRNSQIDRDFCQEHSWARPGYYVALSVSDNGVGMDAETLERVFDPFFTTKETGRGTGLGLATVYGIAKQHNGMVQAHSEHGKGAVFEVYLPVSQKPVVERPGPVEQPPGGGTETILVAEDEDSIRDLAVRILENAGYRVLAARDGDEALRIHEQFAGNVDLLLLDVVMPKVGGRACLEALRGRGMETPCLFTSGYSEEVVASGSFLDNGVQLLPKPYRAEDLLRKVRQLLDLSKG